MAVFSTIAKNTDHFEDKVYVGNGSSQAITGLSFSPDIWWLKARDGNSAWFAQNSTMGIGKNLFYGTSENDAEATTSIVTSRDSNGLTLTNAQTVNGSATGYVGTFLKGGNASTSSNSDGSITSTVQANDTGGISIVEWTGTGANATIGHGLSTAPDCIWIKNRTDSSQHWRSYWHGGNRSGEANTMSEANQVDLWDTAQQQTSSAFWNDTKPTSSVFSVGTDSGVNTSSKSYIAYCFSNRNGFMRSGTYQGNGNVHGSFVFTGFLPQAVIIHKYDSSGESWSYKSQISMFTNKDGSAEIGNGANHGNNIEKNHQMDVDGQETAQDTIQFYSNGFATATTDGKSNGEGNHYVYIAFGKIPMVGTNKILGTAF